jgi:hypothetical protein
MDAGGRLDVRLARHAGDDLGAAGGDIPRRPLRILDGPREDAEGPSIDWAERAEDFDGRHGLSPTALRGTPVTIPRQSRGPSYCEPLKAALGALTRPRLIAT